MKTPNNAPNITEPVRQFKIRRIHKVTTHKKLDKKNVFLTTCNHIDEIQHIPYTPVVPANEPEEPASIKEMLQNVDDMQKTMNRNFDDLAEIGKRVKMTNQILSVHMNTVGNLKSSLNRIQNPTKRMVYHRPLKSTTSCLKIPRYPSNKPLTKTAALKQISSMSKLPTMKSGTEEKQIKNNQPRKLMKSQTKPLINPAKIERDKLGNTIFSSSISKPSSGLKYAKEGKRREFDENLEKDRIMNKLINMAGRMNEFTENLHDQLLETINFSNPGLQSKYAHLYGMKGPLGTNY